MNMAILTAVVALSAFAADGKTAGKKATFAGGCFWCVQPPFDNTPGVLQTVVGYTGGKTADPDYEEVGTGRTGHAEAIEVVYDPARVSYAELVEVFWRSVDPTQANGQFYDKGSQYRTAIFYHDAAQKAEAEASKARLAASGRFDKPIAVEIAAAGKFYPAEEYHQKYYLKNAGHYARYHEASGRDAFFERVWADERALKPFDEARFAADQKAGKIVVLDFYADWCPTCRKQKASLEKILADAAGSLIVYEVDYDRAKETLKRFGVRSQSMVLVFKGNSEVARAGGISDVTGLRALIGKAR